MEKPILIGSYDPGSFGGVVRHISQILKYSSHNFVTFSFETMPEYLKKLFYLSIYAGIKDNPPSILYSKRYKDVSCIHAHGLFPLTLGRRLKSTYHNPVILTLHGTIFQKYTLEHFRNSGKSKFYERYYRLFEDLLDDVDVILTVARWISSQLKSSFGVDSITIPNMIDTQEVLKSIDHNLFSTFNLTPSGYILWLGARVDAPGCKRPEDFIRVAREFPDEIFVMAGKGISRESIKKVVGYDLPSNILFYDLVGMFGPSKSYSAFLTLVKNAKFSILTSYYEAFGYVILESLTLNTPVIVPDIGGPAEIVNKQVGMKYRFFNTDSLLRKVEKMLKIWDKYKRRNLRDYVEARYSSKIVVKKLDKIYDMYC